MTRAQNEEAGGWGKREKPVESPQLPGAAAVLVILSVLILVLPAFAPDGPQARLLPLALQVEPLVIDVERAAWYEWALLDGIGETRARRIVEYVRENRPLKGIGQLGEIGGLPRDWVEKAKPHLRLHGEEAGR